MRQFIILCFVLISTLYAKTAYQQINLGVFSSHENAVNYLDRLNKEMWKEQQQYGFSFVVWPKGEFYAVSTKPIADKQRIERIWPLIEKVQPDAYVKMVYDESLPSDRYVPAPVQKQTKKVKVPVAAPVEKVEKIIVEDPVVFEKDVVVEEFDDGMDMVIQKATEDVGSAKVEIPERDLSQFIRPKVVEPAVVSTEEDSFWSDWSDVIYWLLLLGLLLFALYQHFKLLKYYATLRESEASCQAGIKAKDEFLAKMSHEIRTPMHAIMGFGHLLKETRLSSRQSEYLDKMQSSAELLLNIINDILDFSKIEAGELNIEMVEFNINTILDNVSNLMHVKMYEKDIEFMYDIDNHVPAKMVGDPLRIEQVLTNLLGNAVKFTAEGEISVKVKRIYTDSDDVIIEFAISDTGIGLKPEQIERLFQSYSQASDSTSREYGGTGLGLAISKQLVELMGGEISVTSEFGKGSTFTFFVTAGSQKALEKRQYRLPSKSLVNSNVLIVDRYLKSANTLKQMLTYYHFRSDIVHAENEALYVLKDNTYDMVFIASEFTSQDRKNSIQKYKAISEAKIVLIENSQELISTFMNKQLPVDAILYKPYTQQDLLDMFYEVYSEFKEKTQQTYTREDLSELKGSRILLAEDNQINQRIIFGLFEGSGIEITVAWNGQEAIDQLAEDSDFDMVFMDINMPVMGGYEASRKILEHEEYRHIPIIALTANALNADVQKVKDAGMLMSLSKPLDIQKLYETLFKYIQPRELDESIEAPLDSNDIRHDLKSMFKLSNLNARDGLERANGDIGLYRAVLSEFSKLYYDSVSQFEKMIDARKWDEAQKSSKDIYDLSETIGAYSLSEIVKKLQDELAQRDQGEYKPLLQEYNKELVGVVYSIEFIL